MANPKGCDLSHFNIGISFKAMHEAGISFVYLKATQGATYVDPTFRTRRAEAPAFGLRVGAYHFFDPRVSGLAQAQHFLSIYGQRQHGELPPALDLESTPGWDGLSLAQRVKKVGDWLDAVEKALGVRPMIYTSMGWFKEYFGKSDLSGHPLWLAHYAGQPGDLGLWKAWAAWQYAEHGTIPGAGTNDVDTDQWNGALPVAA